MAKGVYEVLTFWDHPRAGDVFNIAKVPAGHAVYVQGPKGPGDNGGIVGVKRTYSAALELWNDLTDRYTPADMVKR